MTRPNPIHLSKEDHMPHRRRPRRAGHLALTALLLLVAACGSDDDPENSAADDDPTTTEQTTTTTVQAEGPEEWVDVARDLTERAHALVEDPDPDQLAAVYAETCQCWQSHLDTITFLVDNQQRMEGDPPTVLWVRNERTNPESGLVDLTVKAQAHSLDRVSAEGEVVQEVAADAEPSCMSYAIRADGAGGAWRIYTELTLPECPEGS